MRDAGAIPWWLDYSSCVVGVGFDSTWRACADELRETSTTAECTLVTSLCCHQAFGKENSGFPTSTALGSELSTATSDAGFRRSVPELRRLSTVALRVMPCVCLHSPDELLDNDLCAMILEIFGVESQKRRSSRLKCGGSHDNPAFMDEIMKFQHLDIMAPNIGIAIIGGGIFAREQHMPAVMKVDSISLKAIYSRSAKSAKETAALDTKGGTPDLYSDDAGAGHTYHDLLLREDISAVIIALPIKSQPEYIEAALNAGKHVLAEKPIAPDVAGGKKLIEYYKTVSAQQNVTFAVAENVRFWPSFTYAAEAAKGLGKVNHFSIKVFSLMGSDTKWYGTEWRKKPEYQGGFLLDGGVHHAAATRLFLTGESTSVTVRALTSQVQEHLPPIDTVNAIIETKSGASGTFQLSSGSLIDSFEWEFAFEKGTVKVAMETVTVKPVGGKASVKEFDRTTGVSEEVAAWAESLVAGKANALQSPEEALADLEFLEKMFKSGEQDGAVQRYELQ
ncbi:hypothetical protein G7046_g926 [Stylonectria norvegica]|nr:hypothetical protein G7046_g926 [Stylonectria norvegica]